MQRDRAKKARAALKREKRQGNLDEAAAPPEEGAEPMPSSDEELSPAELLHRVEDLHRRFDAKLIDFEAFEEEKAELMRRLPID
jgi:hypothetical protein